MDGAADGPFAVTVRGRVAVTALPVARRCALVGLGIANLPAFACAEDVAAGRLKTILDRWTADVGGVHVVYPHSRVLSASVRALVDLAVERFTNDAALDAPRSPRR